ncbi:unnamed protein product [Closterium sp. NIES-54]
MYAVIDSAEGDCYLCVPPDPGIEAAALGVSASAAPGTSESAAPGTSESASPSAGESALSATAPTEALHTFTLDSVLAHSSMALPCPAASSRLLSELHLPSFSMNLVSGADLQDVRVDQFTPGGQRVTHCTCFRTGRHLATFTCRPGSSLYTPTTASPPVTASGQVATSGQVAASGQVFAAVSRSSPVYIPCSSRPLSHETLLWHHRLGHLSLPRLRGMASRTLVSGLPRSLPPLPTGPAPTCVPFVNGRQRAAPHSSEFPPTEAPLQTLHMDTTVFPLRRKGEDTEVLIDWIRGARRQLSESFGSDFPVLRLHSGRGGEFSSDLLRAFCRAEGIRQTFTLPASPQQNGIAERRIGMVMDVARTSMIHAAAPHFLWPFAVQYAAHQINLQPRVSLPETTPTLRWTGKVGDVSVFRFYHPTSRRVLSSKNVTFVESVSYYRLFPYRTASLPPSPLFLALGAPPVDSLPPQGPAPSGVSLVDPVEPVKVAVDSGAATGAERAGARPGGAVLGVAESEGAEPGGAEPERVVPGGAEPGGVEPEGAKPGGAEPKRAESGGPPGVPLRREPLSLQRLREWYARHCSRAAGATRLAAGGASGAGAAGGAAGARAAGAAGPGGAGPGGAGAVGGPTGVGAAGGTGAAGPGGACTRGTGATGASGATGVGAVGAEAVATGGAAGARAAGGTRAGGAAGDGDRGVGGTGAGGAAGVVAGDPRAEGTGDVSAVSGGAARPRPYYVPLLQQVLGLPPSTGRTPPLQSPPPVLSQSQFQLASPLPGPSPYSGPTRGLTERREPESPPASPESHPASPESRRVPRPSPPASSLPDGPDTESDSIRAASPTVTRFLATAVTDPSFESTAASALVAELSAFVCPPSVKGDCALGTDVLEDSQEEFECFAAAVPHLVSMLLVLEGDPDAPDIPTPRSYAEAIEGPSSSQWQTAMDTEMASWKSTGTYVDEVPPPGANIGVDFSPTPKMTTLRVVLHVAAQRDYELHSLDFSTAFLQGNLHEEIWLRRPPVLYVDNKAMLALCQEHRMEHRTKHIALRYFLAQELQ